MHNFLSIFLACLTIGIAIALLIADYYFISGNVYHAVYEKHYHETATAVAWSVFFIVAAIIAGVCIPTVRYFIFVF